MATSEILQHRAEIHAVPMQTATGQPVHAGRMEAWLNRFPLEQRVEWTNLLVAAVVAVILSLGIVGWTVVDTYTESRTAVVGMAKEAAANIRSTFPSAEQQTREILHSLKTKERVLAASVYLTNGQLLASLSDTKVPPRIALPFSPGTETSLASLIYREPVAMGGGQKWLVLVTYDLGPGWRRVGNTAMSAVLVMAVAMLISIAVSRHLLKPAIVAPYRELSSVVNAIPVTGSFESRISPGQDPEVGRLSQRLNQLFEELQDREARLNEAKLDLELNVLTRTSELQHQIEDRKRAEIALKESEMQYRNLFENNPMPMFVMDLESLQFLAVNHAAIQHYGYSAREFGRFTLQILTHDADSARVARAFRSVARSFDAGAWRHRCRNGEIIDVQLTAHTIAFRGTIAKIVLANDITERKQAERALEEMNKKLVETSRQAGMAEIATGVLHNVGNVLNSVNVSAAVLAKNIERSKALGITKVAQLLDANHNDLAGFFGSDGRGKALPRYLSSLAGHVEEERGAQLAELDLLTRNITHIKEIVAMQQNYAKIRGVMEAYDSRELVEEALRLTKVDLEQARVQVRLDCAPKVDDVLADRHKALQIFVNLISNARQAMSETAEKERNLEITIRTGELGGSRISFRDNGCGIAPENLTRIFNHGFTTKKEGHGFGLHGSANAAREMKGWISVNSPGLGRGATFTVELPGLPKTTAPALVSTEVP